MEITNINNKTNTTEHQILNRTHRRCIADSLLCQSPLQEASKREALKCLHVRYRRGTHLVAKWAVVDRAEQGGVSARWASRSS